MVAWGCCRELGAAPALSAIGGLLRDLLGRVAPGLVDDARLRALVPELAVVLPELVHPIPSAIAEACPAAYALEPRSKHRVFDAAVRTLTLAALSVR